MPTIQEKVYTLTQLNTSFEKWVTREFGSRRISISCQISKINSKNGHYYLELTDSKDGQRTASARGNIWSSRYADIQREFKTYGLLVEDVLKPGHEIVADVTITFHKLFGLSLTIYKIDPRAVIGDIEQQKRQTQIRLEKEGLLELQRRLYLGPINKKIGVVGSPGTSGYEDFTQELFHNDIFRNFTTKTFEATVQGDHAVPSLVRAIKEANAHDVDCIVVIRGGGSKMDLHVFNHYEVCKAIAYSRVPVIVGIGHETDSTLVDEVAFSAEKTPTAAAKMLYVKIGVFSSELSHNMSYIARYAEGLIAASKQELHMYTTSIFSSTDFLLERVRELIERAERGTAKGSLERIAEEKEVIGEYSNTLFSRSRQHIENGMNELQFLLQEVHQKVGKSLAEKNDHINAQMQHVISAGLHSLRTDQPSEISRLFQLIALKARHQITQEQNELHYLSQKLQLVDPVGLFDRGYTISTVDGVDVGKFDGVLNGKTLVTFTKSVTLKSTITHIDRHDERTDQPA